MVTFCDGAEPQIIEVFQLNESIFKDIIKFIKGDLYLQFNNSAFFTPKRNNYIQMFWDLYVQSYSDFTIELESLQPKSLSLTQQILEERTKLENSVNNLTPQINNTLNIMNNFKTEINQVEKLKGDSKDNKNFEINDFYTEQINFK